MEHIELQLHYIAFRGPYRLSLGPYDVYSPSSLHPWGRVKNSR